MRSALKNKSAKASSVVGFCSKSPVDEQSGERLQRHLAKAACWDLGFLLKMFLGNEKMKTSR